VSAALKSAPNVKVAVEGHVAVLTLDSPPHNYMTVSLMKDLADICDAADADNNIRAMVLQAEGKSFCAGADLTARDGDGEPAIAGEVHPLYRNAVRLYSAKKPIVAAVHGAAIGAGLGLTLAADFRIVSSETRLAANFVKLAFHPGFGISYALPRLIGEQKAALMLLTGRRIKGDEAVAWGLADELVAPDAVRSAALKLAQEIAENSPLSILAIRKTLRAGFAEAVEKRLVHEFNEQMKLVKTEDFAEGVRAVAERRPGRFTGR
jgi:enoyl-CoA hydratase/carnithine racemase